MTDLSDLIRRSAKAGKLNHLSVAFTNGMWETYYRGVDDKDKRIARHKDVVCSMVEALTGKKADAPKEVLPPKEKPAAKPAPKVHDPLDDL